MAAPKHIFNQEQRRWIVRFLVFLSLIRWYNLLVVAVAQYLAAYFILHDDPPLRAVLLDGRLFGVVVSTALVIAGGYIINAFYDLEKDMANRPEEVIMGRILSKAGTLRAWLLINFTGMLLSASLSWKLLLFNGFFAFLLWFYSHKLKKKPFLGNLAAAVLTVAAFFTVCVYYGFVNEVIWIYACFIVLVTLIREVVKDLEAMKGDVVFGYQTFPVVHGLLATKRLLYGLMLLSALPFAWLYAQQPTTPVLGFLTVSVLLLGWSAWKIAISEHIESFAAVNNVLKLLILLGVGSIALL